MIFFPEGPCKGDDNDLSDSTLSCSRGVPKLSGLDVGHLTVPSGFGKFLPDGTGFGFLLTYSPGTSLDRGFIRVNFDRPEGGRWG